MSRCGSLMGTVSQTSFARRACRGEWRRGSPSTPRNRAVTAGSHAAEAVDLLLELRPLLGIADAEALLGGQGEDADLALVGVVLDVAGGLAHVVHRVHLGQRRVDQAPV